MVIGSSSQLKNIALVVESLLEKRDCSLGACQGEQVDALIPQIKTSKSLSRGGEGFRVRASGDMLPCVLASCKTRRVIAYS